MSSGLLPPINFPFQKIYPTLRHISKLKFQGIIYNYESLEISARNIDTQEQNDRLNTVARLF